MEVVGSITSFVETTKRTNVFGLIGGSHQNDTVPHCSGVSEEEKLSTPPHQVREPCRENGIGSNFPTGRHLYPWDQDTVLPSPRTSCGAQLGLTLKWYLKGQKLQYVRNNDIFVHPTPSTVLGSIEGHPSRWLTEVIRPFATGTTRQQKQQPGEHLQHLWHARFPLLIFSFSVFNVIFQGPLWRLSCYIWSTKYYYIWSLNKHNRPGTQYFLTCCTVHLKGNSATIKQCSTVLAV